MNIWKKLLTQFDEKLPRRTAVLIKENTQTTAFYYPTNLGMIGYNLDNRAQSTYEEAPAFTFYIDEVSFGGLKGSPIPSRIPFYFSNMESGPNYIGRDIIFANAGLMAEEELSNPLDTGVNWSFTFEPRTIHCEFKKRLYLIFTGETTLQASRDIIQGKEVFTLKLEDGRGISIAPSEDTSFGLYQGFGEYREDALKGQLNSKLGEGRYFILTMDIIFPRVKSSKDFGSMDISFGISSLGPEEAMENLVEDAWKKTQDLWNDWFARIPAVDFKNEEELQAYYKCWTVVKQNYYVHDKWGRILLEALPVYKGVWTWGTSALPYNSLLDPQYPGVFARNALNLFFDTIREDGYIAHAIYIDEKKPGERWGRGKGIIQDPHFPWVALAYYKKTQDKESLEKWYEPMVRFYKYISKTRDEDLENLHLWAATTSFDTGLDVTPMFTDITYYDEEYVYPSVFAAERCVYERSMGQIAKILGRSSDAKFWDEEARLTLEASEKLWDPQKAWYGVLHCDGTLETVVGLDGLFFLGYGLVSCERAEKMRNNFKKLIAPYGIHTIAPDEEVYEGDIYWRGPAWPKSCATGARAVMNYYPELKEEVTASLVNWALRWPSIWECLNGQTGDVARGDAGVLATPCISSNVGAGELIGAFRVLKGLD
jgi:hypothetical protein